MEQLDNVNSLSTDMINYLTYEVNESIKYNKGRYKYEVAVLDDEYPDEVMNELLSKYYDAGWKYIYWLRFSEVRSLDLSSYQRHFTRILFSTTPLDKDIVSNKKLYVRS